MSCSACRWAKTIPTSKSPDARIWIRCAKGRWQSGAVVTGTCDVLFDDPQEMLFTLDDVLMDVWPLDRFFLACSYFENMEESDDVAD